MQVMWVHLLKTSSFVTAQATQAIGIAKTKSQSNCKLIELFIYFNLVQIPAKDPSPCFVTFHQTG